MPTEEVSVEQIVGVLKRTEVGKPVAQLIRKIADQYAASRVLTAIYTSQRLTLDLVQNLWSDQKLTPIITILLVHITGQATVLTAGAQPLCSCIIGRLFDWNAYYYGPVCYPMCQLLHTLSIGVAAYRVNFAVLGPLLSDSGRKTKGDFKSAARC